MTQNINKLEALLEQRIEKGRSVASVVRESLISIEKAIAAGIGLDEIVLDIQDAYNLEININTLRSAVQRERKKLTAKDENPRVTVPEHLSKPKTSTVEKPKNVASDISECNTIKASKNDNIKEVIAASKQDARDFFQQHQRDEGW